MAWWEKLFEPMPTGNLVGDTLSAINGSPAVSAARSESGSFDPNKIKAVIPSGMESDLGPIFDMQTALASQKQQAMMDAYRPPQSTFMQGIGRALHALSAGVPGNNPAYTNMIAGNNLQLDWNKRLAGHEDRLNELRASGAADLYSGLGQAGISYMQDRYKKRSEARTKIGEILAAGSSADGSVKPEYAAMAEQYAKANGFSDEWERVKSAIKTGTPSAAAPAQTGGDPSAAETPAGAGTAASLGPMLGGMSDMAKNLPGAIKAPGDEMPIYQRPPEVQKLYDEAARVSIVDEKRGAMLLKQAEISDRAAADVWEKKNAQKYQRDSWFKEPIYVRNKNTGETRIAQLGSVGGLQIAPRMDSRGQPIPEDLNVGDWEVMTEGQRAAEKKMGSGYGERYEKIQEAGASGIDMLQMLSLAGEALSTGVYTGIGANAISAARRLAVATGLADEETVKKQGAVELIQGLQNRMALLMRGGGQMPGALSDNDIKFLQQAQFGVDKTPETNRMMIEAQKRLAQRQIDVARMADRYILKHGSLDAGFNEQLRQFAEKNDLFTDFVGKRTSVQDNPYAGKSIEELKRMRGL